MNSFFRGLVTLTAICFWAGATPLWADEASALLARADEQRAFPNMVFALQITSYEAEKPLATNLLWGYVKLSSGGNKTLLWFADPAAVKGRKMLMDGPTVYLLFPKTRNPIRLSPLQVLLGESSNGDVARTGFSQDYDVQALTSESREGFECHRFELSAKPSVRDSNYRRVSLWVDKATLRLVSADFYGGDDRKLKSARYLDYRTVEGKSLPFVMDITDSENPSHHTVMTYRSLASKVVPDSAFRREYLESWSPEAPR